MSKFFGWTSAVVSHGYIPKGRIAAFHGNSISFAAAAAAKSLQ